MLGRQIAPIIGWTTFGIAVMCIIEAFAYILLELISPSLSGLSPWDHLVLLPLAITVSAGIAAVVSGMAALAHWPPLKLREHLFAFGAVCSIPFLWPVLGLFAWPIMQLIPNNDFASMLLAFVAATWVRHHLASASA